MTAVSAPCMTLLFQWFSLLDGHIRVLKYVFRTLTFAAEESSGLAKCSNPPGGRLEQQ